MFRHKGKNRSYVHNLRLAALLSFVAGLVNITGLLSINILTTNLTGHFAYISDTLSGENPAKALIYVAFIFSFLSGSFITGLLGEIAVRKYKNLSYVLPILVEITVLLIAGLSADLGLADNFFLACMLLFAMGLQNSLVTRVSQSVVRTTHLTGLFTDLGIELSQLFFYQKDSQRFFLRKSIGLKMSVVLFFFLGGLTGGYCYKYLALKTLFIGCTILLVALLYDFILLKYYHVRRKVFHH